MTADMHWLFPTHFTLPRYLKIIHDYECIAIITSMQRIQRLTQLHCTSVQKDKFNDKSLVHHKLYKAESKILKNKPTDRYKMEYLSKECTNLIKNESNNKIDD